MNQCSQRIISLREHALTCDTRSGEWPYLLAKGFMLSRDEISTVVRHGIAKQYQLSNVRAVIDGLELIVGKRSARVLTQAENDEWALIQKYGFSAQPNRGGQASHMAVDYEKLLTLGVSGVQDEITGRMEALDIADPSQMEQHDFYRSCLLALDGLCVLSEHYACEAERLASEANPERREELLEIARVCRRVPKFPAKTFREALQSIHLLSVAMVGLYQLGRPDRYLYPYYLNDIRSGSLDHAGAQELVDCLCVLFNEYIDRGLAVGLMVGGRDAQGKNVSNELTEMFLNSISHTKMIYPGVGACLNRDTPKEILRLCCEILGEGHSHPALFNDDVIIKGLMSYGLPYEEACEYIHSTCVEITPCKSSACWVASPYINLVQLLLNTLHISETLSDPREFASFELLKQAYKETLQNHVRKCIVEQNRYQAERTHFGADPLVSCFVNDCLAQGVDIEQGGARYNWIMPSFVGMANLADALYALKIMIFDAKETDMATLADALRKDFAGYEALYAQMMRRIPKYGNDDNGPDETAVEIVSWLSEVLKGYTSYRGGMFIPSMFCWVMHDEFGSVTMATPDGRRAGYTLGDGSGPAQGREAKGPTASILSSTKWDHTPFVGGVAVNMKFGKKLFDAHSIDKLESLIQVFLARGGFELQINVVDRDVLLKAQQNPELYGDLVVRIGGYSDYFTRLTPAKQLEVIERTEHGL